MKKKILLILFALLSLLLFGCGLGKTTTSTKTDSLPSSNGTSSEGGSKSTNNIEEKITLDIGSTVSLSDIQKYTKSKSNYEVYAIKKINADSFTIISTDDATPAYVDIPGDGGTVRLYPASREFMLNLDDSELIVFTNGTPASALSPAYDLTYFAPFILNKDLSKMYLETKNDINAKQFFTESIISSNKDITGEENVDVSGLSLNGNAISEINPAQSTDETVFGYLSLDNDKFADGCSIIHTGFTKELTLEGSIGSDPFSATLKPALGFFGYGLEGDEPAFSYTESADGYYVYDFTSDSGISSELLKNCGLIDEEDWYSRLMISDQSVLGFTSSNSSAPADVMSNATGETQIEVSWNASTVTFWDDPSKFDISSAEVVYPYVYCEGNNWVGGEPDITGDTYTDFITIPDPNEFVHVFVEPSAPTNNCPLDTVTVKITHPDGSVETFNGADRMVRGQTGIWYIEVYEQGN